MSVSEVARKSGLQPWEVSRMLNSIKSQSVGVRLGFEANLEKAGLLEIATISRKNLEKAPYVPYLRAQRVLRVLGRRLFLYTGILPAEDAAIEEWLSTFEESALTVKALEHRWWRVDSPATVYREGCVCGDIEAVKVTDRREVALPVKEVELDEKDILLLWAKFRWPFASLREAERESEKYIGRKVSHQVLSWHFRNHVLKLWAGNRVRLYADAQQVPYRLLYLEGKDAPALARALV